MQLHQVGKEEERHEPDRVTQIEGRCLSLRFLVPYISSNYLLKLKKRRRTVTTLECVLLRQEIFWSKGCINILVTPSLYRVA